MVVVLVMVVAAHQPQYLPWLGYFHKMASCDVFVVLDGVQYKRREWQNRNRIKSPNGVVWLTVPVVSKYGQAINQVRVDKTKKWQKKHRNAVKLYYSKAKCFSDFFLKFSSLWEEDYAMFMDVAMDSIKIIRGILGINTPIILSSSISVKKAGTERLVAICKEFGAEAYLSGQGARNYLEEDKFRREGIDVLWQEFKHPEYPQLWGSFVPNLSTLDFIMNIGYEAKKILKNTLSF